MYIYVYMYNPYIHVEWTAARNQKHATPEPAYSSGTLVPHHASSLSFSLSLPDSPSLSHTLSRSVSI